jgi:hypothetical protein
MTPTRWRWLWCPTALTAALFVGATAQAFTINVDFGAGELYSGTALAEDPGTVWNAVDSTNTTDGPLVDSMGNPTPITITKSNVVGAFTTPVLNPSHVDPAVPVGTAGAFDALTRDGILSLGCPPASCALLTLNGVPAGEYRIFLYEIRGEVTDTTGFGVRGLGEYGVDSTNPDDEATVGFVLSEDYPSFGLVSPDAQGRLFIDFGPGFASETGAINGLQLQLIPEPNIPLLLGAGVVALAAGRRAQIRSTI